MAHPCSDLTGSLCPRLSDGPSVHGPERVAGPTHSLSPTCLHLDRPPASQVKAEALASHCLGHSGQSSLKTAPGLVPKLHGDRPALGTQQVTPDATRVGGSRYPWPHQLQDLYVTSPPEDRPLQCWPHDKPQGTRPVARSGVGAVWTASQSNQEALHLETAPKRISQT